MLFDESADPREHIAREIGRLHDRLSSMSADRLAAELPPWPSRAAAAHATARRIALLAQGVEAGSSPQPPAYRELPDVQERIVADQLAVCTHDFLMALTGIADSTPVWVGVTRATVAQVMAEAGQALTDLRRTL